MKIKYSFVFLFGIILASCAGQRNAAYTPIPDESFYEFERTIGISMDNIIETKDGLETDNIPLWLRHYLTGGIEAVERLGFFLDKYIFIESSRGENLIALNKWLEFFIVKQDIAKLIAARIERRMISTSSLYPDDEYGLFFERLVKNAHNAEYPDAAEEDNYWIKIAGNNENGGEVYLFFLIASIDKVKLQTVMEEMMGNTFVEVNSSRRRVSRRNPQVISINNLRQNFFEGF